MKKRGKKAARAVEWAGTHTRKDGLENGLALNFIGTHSIDSCVVFSFFFVIFHGQRRRCGWHCQVDGITLAAD